MRGTKAPGQKMSCCSAASCNTL